MAIYMWRELNTQGPCLTGYHVPISEEWQKVIDAGVSLGAWTTSNGDGIRTKLKLPFAGDRPYNSGKASNQGTIGFYYCSNYNTGTNLSDRFGLYSGGISIYHNSPTATAMSIRPFKDTPVTPDNTRTTLYGTLSAGIFMKDGLISISSDGSNWITIADKNLGATTVYNDGDTLSQANCGKYYQWGNNYGFAWTGSITTSSTKVDASGYGPGNRYSSSTFITASASPYNWDSSNNGNLRGYQI